MPDRGRGGQPRPRRHGAHRRPAALLSPPPRLVGIDLGGTKCLGVSVGPDGTVLAEHRVATPRGGPAVLEALAGVAAALGPAAALGVGVPGLVSLAGVLRVAPNLPGVEDLDVRAALQERFASTVVRVDNDATCAGWAESRTGAARDCAHALLVTLGTGIGGGVVVDGHVLRGANGFAGEIGHMVVDPDGPPCPCGQRGCWERFASGGGLGRLGRESAAARPLGRLAGLAGGDPEAVRGEHVTAAAAEGDGEALAVMERFAWWVALGLVNLANVFDPEVVVLGGGLVEAGDVLLDPVRARFADLALGGGKRDVRIEAAVLGEHAGAIGAALLAGEELPA
ncbi:MAG: ROK family protein [Actinomycetota bacterium]